MKTNALLETLRYNVTGAIERGEKEAILEMGTALFNEEMIESANDDIIRQAIEQATNIGKQAGESAAEWIIQDSWGGRVTRGEKESAKAFLESFENGDCDLCPPNLSGEWADSETPASLMAICFCEDWQDEPAFRDAQDDICNAWQIACEDAFWTTLQKSAQSVLE